MTNDIKVLLLVGGAWFHDQPDHRKILSGFIGARFDLTMTDRMSALTPANLARYDVIANYTTAVEPTQEQIGALLEAIKGGKGYVSLHAGTATFLNSPEHIGIVGQFMGHDPVKELLVQISTLKPGRVVYPHPITEGVADFAVEDELFIVEGDMTKWQVLARAEGHTVLYNTMYGQGRVHSNTLGHDSRSLGNLSYQTLVLNGIEWVAGLR